MPDIGPDVSPQMSSTSSLFFARQSYVALSLIALLLASCSFNPNLRKQEYSRRGEHYLEKGNYRAAAIEFANAIRIDPNYADAHLQLANTYLKLQQPEHAYLEFSYVVNLRPEDYQTQITMTNLLIASRKFVQAQDQANLLLQRRPNDPAVHSMVSGLLASHGNIQAAIGEMRKTIALAPDQWAAYLSLALLQLKSGEPDAAEANLRKVIELDPHSVSARVLLGTYYESRNRLPEAEQAFRDAMTMNAKSMEPRDALAKLLLAEGRNEAAEDILEQARRELPNDPESLLDLSNFYFITGDLNKAIAEYNALYQQHPQEMQIKKKYIQLLIRVKRYDEARRLDDEILQAAPGDSDALLYRSQMQVSEGNANDAVQTLLVVIKNAPDNSDAHYTMGVAFEKQGDLERAEREWLEALRLNPDLLDAERSIANAAIEKNDMHMLENAATQIVRLEPRAAEGYALMALSSMNLKQFENAEYYVRKAIEVAQNGSFGYVQLGNLRFLQRRYGEATSAYEQALNLNSNSTDALRGIVGVYVAEKQIDKAVAVTNAQIGKEPGNSRFYGLLGGLLFHGTRDLNAAQAALEKATALDAHNLDAWLQLCEVRAAKGEIAQAITTNLRALQSNPGRAALYVLLGNLYETTSEWKHAETAYQNALAIDSHNPIASNDLARAMLQTGESLDVALSQVQAARAELPDSPAVFDTMGWIYYSKGSYPLALTCLRQALSLQASKKMPESPDIHYHLGMTYKKLGQPGLARQHFEQVLKINPAYPAANQIKLDLTALRS